ncbi:hypothetical protein CERSUDRAFT_118680 [Gelatoporia subvermispora B]|uniref:RING-type domain-containing protein n=1 Tax=Ceriporiopsis subvermispora (strain B) TaxID=914234 RepID=M2Q740_CERS8|nr:hypothetical protein CERSUDRAFT_118680 [Gelatoporia subvermispora B]
MSSREPMWYCHECHAEMRPLMVPDPHCASCNGTFVERLENPSDDPRDRLHAPDGFGRFGEDPLANEIETFLTGLRTILRGPDPAQPRTPRNRSGSPDAFRPASPSRGSDRPAPQEPARGPTLRFDRTGDEPMRTFILRPPGQGRGADRVPPLSEFLGGARDSGPQDRNPLTGPLLAHYLLTMLASRQPGGDDFPGLLGGLFGPPPGAENGRWGDYALNQEALDQIITQIMEQSNPNAPVPATEAIMEKLPRKTLTEGSEFLDRDCAVCKDQFKLDVEDPEERIVVTLPCSHPFHQSCIMPWLKTSGTCPVCRYQLIPQPSGHAAGAGPPRTSGSNNHYSRPQGMPVPVRLRDTPGSSNFQPQDPPGSSNFRPQDPPSSSSSQLPDPPSLSSTRPHDPPSSSSSQPPDPPSLSFTRPQDPLNLSSSRSRDPPSSSSLSQNTPNPSRPPGQLRSPVSSNPPPPPDHSRSGRGDSRRASGFGGGNTILNMIGHFLHGGDRNERRGNNTSNSSRPSTEGVPGNWPDELD